MILHRYIFKEILKTQVIVLVVLLTVFLSQSIIRLISRAAAGSIPSELISTMAMLAIPEIAMIFLPLTLFVAVLITLGRICSDSEMVVMRSVGFSPANVMSITLILAAVTMGVCALNSIYAVPEAARMRVQLKQDAQNNPQFLPIESGRFVSLGDGFTLYLDEVHAEGATRQVHNVYVFENPFDRVHGAVTLAKNGALSSNPEGVQWIHLTEGSRHEGSVELGSFRKASFDAFDAPVSAREADEREEDDRESMSFTQLWQSDDPRAHVEAQWRLSPIFAVLVLVIVAVPLSMVNPRQGRFAKLMPAILIYASYYIFLLGVRNLMNSGTLGLYPGLYIVPLAFLLLAALPLNLPRHTLKKLIKLKTEGKK